MNLREKILNFLRSLVGEVDVNEAGDIGEGHADILVGAYLDRFSKRASTLMSASHAGLLGYEPDDIIDAEFETIPSADDYEGWSRPDLMRECRESDTPITYTTSSTSKELVGKLVRRDKKIAKETV